MAEHGFSQDLEKGCPNKGFIDFRVSKLWYKVHTTIEVNHTSTDIAFLGQYYINCFGCMRPNAGCIGGLKPL